MGVLFQSTRQVRRALLPCVPVAVEAWITQVAGDPSAVEMIEEMRARLVVVSSIDRWWYVGKIGPGRLDAQIAVGGAHRWMRLALNEESSRWAAAGEVERARMRVAHDILYPVSTDPDSVRNLVEEWWSKRFTWEIADRALAGMWAAGLLRGELRARVAKVARLSVADLEVFLSLVDGGLPSRDAFEAMQLLREHRPGRGGR